MTSSVDLEQAHRLREAENKWLRQSADRIRAAHARPDQQTSETSETGEDDR